MSEQQPTLIQPQNGRMSLSDPSWLREHAVELRGRARAATLGVFACFGAAGLAFGIGELEPIAKPFALLICSALTFVGCFRTPRVLGDWQDLRALLRRLESHPPA